MYMVKYSTGGIYASQNGYMAVHEYTRQVCKILHVPTLISKSTESQKIQREKFKLTNSVVI